MDRDLLHSLFLDAVEKAGSLAGYGAIVGASRQSVSKRKMRRGIIPAEHVIPIERALGIPRGCLRPDLHPPG
jgi:DNA-binding transcriptional regulator YdaS (Cro superfamily)